MTVDVPECATCHHSTYHSPRLGCAECRESGPGHVFTPVEIDHAAGGRAWLALLTEATRVGWPRAYSSDLFRDWQAICRRGSAEPFVWVLREHGTDLVWTQHRQDAPTWCTPAEHPGRNFALEWLTAVLHTYQDRRVYYWDGWKLIPISRGLALAIIGGDEART